MKPGSMKDIVKSSSHGRKSISSRNGFSTWDILIPDPKDVSAYLKKHLGLKSFLPAVFSKVRSVFGPDTELSLALYRDPEIDDVYLTLTLRQRKYAAHFMDTIEQVSEQFHRKLEKVAGICF